MSFSRQNISRRAVGSMTDRKLIYHDRYDEVYHSDDVYPEVKEEVLCTWCERVIPNCDQNETKLCVFCQEEQEYLCS